MMHHPKRLSGTQLARVAVLTLIAISLSGLPALAGEKRLTMWGTPPKEKPHMTKAAEGFPPLPLPVVPQRRTEKKRPPAAPKLIANVSNFSFHGWQGSPGAVDTLLKNARRNLDVWYGWEQIDIARLERLHDSGVTHRTPVLYLCAYYPLELTKGQRAALRDYLLAGGTLLINCCGQDEAYASAKAELEAMLPNYPLRDLPLDHPIYHSFYKITDVSYPVPAKNAAFAEKGLEKTDRPRLEGLTLGTRAAVILSYEDLACGWNQWNNPTVKRVSTTDSTRLGLNIITYVTAEQRFAKFLSKTREVAGPSIRPRQQLSFVQLIHHGNWNPNPSAVPMFLKDLASNTSVAVEFQRQAMQIKDPALFEHPMLYMTGSWNPNLAKDEVALLRRYLTSGGLLVADAASGRVEFDQAFRQMVMQVLPGSKLEPVPTDHPLMRSFYKIQTVHVNHAGEPVEPALEMVSLDGRPAIIYSPIGLSDGWAQQFSAYARAYSASDALKLGTNIVVFAMQ